MNDEPVPRNLRERTGRHLCIQCLADVPADVYFRNDYICDPCAELQDDYPLATTPDAAKSDK